MKSILTYFGDDAGLETRLQAALDLARTNGGHLTGILVRPTMPFLGIDPYGGTSIPQSVFDAFFQMEAQARSKVESKLAHEDVSWTDISANDPVSASLIAHAALNDIIVLSRPCESGREIAPSHMIADVLTGAPIPVLLMPEGQIGFDPHGSAAVAWNGSFEAANALRSALPLLRHASSVTLISIEEDKEHRFPQTTVSEYLSRHGITSDLVTQSPGSASVDDALLSAAAGRCNADYLVMGAFGHSRAREFWLGGVTRSLLKSAPLPIIFGR